MKKLYATSQWKEYIRIRQKRGRKRRLAREKDAAGQSAMRQKQRARKRRRLAQLKPVYLKAPARFSLIENQDEFNDFLIKVRRGLEEHGKIEVDHREVELQTPEALLAFLSVVADPRFRDTIGSGTIPLNPAQRQIFLDSGLGDHLILRGVSLPKTSGNIVRRKNHRVEPVIAAGLKKFAMERMLGEDRRNAGLYRMLIELMANTHNHAAGKAQQREYWWTSVYCPDRNRACFTFVDNGVGIFKSVSEAMGRLRLTARLLGIQNNVDFLKQMLNGTLKSRTRLENRGKGIPMIYRLAEDGFVQNLTVITNDVWARISAGDYRRLENEFPGTLWYWEVNREN